MLRISCPKCGKNEKAELMEVHGNRRYRFKCHQCNIFFELAGEESERKADDRVFAGRQGNDSKLDRRRNIRYLVQENITVSLFGETIRNGKVKDISAGGLSFEYLEPASDEILGQEALKRNICLSVNGFNLSEVACQIVCDIAIETPDENPALLTKMLAKRCGVQFGTLSEDQAAQLNLFLQAHTKGVAPSWSKTTK